MNPFWIWLYWNLKQPRCTFMFGWITALGSSPSEVEWVLCRYAFFALCVVCCRLNTGTVLHRTLLRFPSSCAFYHISKYSVAKIHKTILPAKRIGQACYIFFSCYHLILVHCTSYSSCLLWLAFNIRCYSLKNVCSGTFGNGLDAAFESFPNTSF